jgi:hypothetical protein
VVALTLVPPDSYLWQRRNGGRMTDDLRSTGPARGASPPAQPTFTSARIAALVVILAAVVWLVYLRVAPVWR